ncbi:MAG: hypothetical protein JWQ42_2256 [Edaphobacter sp.]|nr:hypothetical protein [Edaphobacter sp.]
MAEQPHLRLPGQGHTSWSTTTALRRKLKSLVAEIKTKGGRADAISADLGTPDGDTDMSNFTKTETGREVALGMQTLKQLGKPDDVADVVALWRPMRRAGSLHQYSRRWRFEALTDNVRKAMNNTLSKGKEIKIPGPDHPITISSVKGKVRAIVAGKIVAESTQALRLEEKGYPPVYYLPRNDADMSLLVRTTHYTYCPYKGDCSYYSIPIGDSRSENAVWT